MVFSLVMTFIKTISTVFGNLKAISLPYPTKEVAREVRLIGRLFKMEMSSSKMHALMRLNALMDGNPSLCQGAPSFRPSHKERLQLFEDVCS